MKDRRRAMAEETLGISVPGFEHVIFAVLDRAPGAPTFGTFATTLQQTGAPTRPGPDGPGH